MRHNWFKFTKLRLILLLLFAAKTVCHEKAVFGYFEPIRIRSDIDQQFDRARCLAPTLIPAVWAIQHVKAAIFLSNEVTDSCVSLRLTKKEKAIPSFSLTSH